MNSHLGVNLDPLVVLRQLKGAHSFDLREAMRLVEAGGADQVIVHLGEKRSLIQSEEVRRLRSETKKEFKLQIAPSLQRVHFAVRIRPDWVCLTPDHKSDPKTDPKTEMTPEKLPESCLNLAPKSTSLLENSIALLKEARIRVACSIDSKTNSIRICKKLGADAVEFQTEAYTLASREVLGVRSSARMDTELDRLKKGAVLARSLGLQVHVRGGLDSRNVRPLVDLQDPRDPFVKSYHVGQSIACRSLLVGLERAVREVVSAILAP